MDWASWQPREDATLLFVIRDGQVLLIHKKRGIGAGKINGAGGRVHAGESPRQAAVREVEEELLVTPRDVTPHGEVWFHVTDGTAIRIHVFSATGLDGEPQETDEAAPLWVPVDAVPYEQMWEDDRHWLPHVLAGRRVLAKAVFEGDRMLSCQVEVRSG